ncbi:hypothetical protein [Thioalkalivibrio sp. ALJT]|uniref:hypothetical protein n=1 Tax=Thioalkalivibrio sp. ALJT TaxID=1158146 RepID=UPI0012DC1A61|nr:hypothetical protein [Thioalkalivibrio sp. ALJT]
MPYEVVGSRCCGFISYDTDVYFSNLKPMDFSLNSWVEASGELRVFPLSDSFYEFESSLVYQACESVFLQGGCWEDTEYFKKILKKIEGGRVLWNCQNRDDLVRRFYVDIQGIYDSMKLNGFLLQEEIISEKKPHERMLGVWNKGSGERHRLSKRHEVQIGIGQSGKVLFFDGRHRLAIAKILKIGKIPVDCIVVHNEMVDRLADLGFCKSV